MYEKWRCTMPTSDQRSILTCHYVRLFGILRVHWHTGGGYAGGKMGRLRGVWVCGWLLPLKYYTI